MFVRLAVFAALVVGASVFEAVDSQGAGVESDRDLALRQFEDDDSVARAVRARHVDRTWRRAALAGGVAMVGLALFAGDLRRLLRGRRPTPKDALAMAALLMPMAGCAKPFEPVSLEEVGNHEYAFLIPYTGDTTKQTSVSNEDYLKRNMVLTKQVRIPQQWVQRGYETFFWNGEWRPAAKLLKVDGSPVTREWTADPNSGTSNRNEAIWVMTSDQVEFSTGWTITARVGSRDDAVKFLANYPNGSLKDVLDTEVRSKLQAAFGIEVTDLPMEELRKAAAPHVRSTIKEVTTTFAERGITITNLGISGGFVYKDPSIIATMVRVFNADQERAIAAAATAAQEEKNKRVLLEADGKARAILAESKAESEGIKVVADAKAYEIAKAKEDIKIYLELKRLDLERERLQRWDGKFPTYFVGEGGRGPEMLLTAPGVAEAK